MVIKDLKKDFSICKIKDFSGCAGEFVFFAKTDNELSLVCETNFIPLSAYEHCDGWQAFRVEGQLDFSIVGILSEITSLLAAENIPVFTVSTFDTDYILTQNEFFARALNVLRLKGYTVI